MFTINPISRTAEVFIRFLLYNFMGHIKSLFLKERPRHYFRTSAGLFIAERKAYLSYGIHSTYLLITRQLFIDSVSADIGPLNCLIREPAQEKQTPTQAGHKTTKNLRNFVAKIIIARFTVIVFELVDYFVCLHTFRL